MDWIRPPALKRGSRIALVSPSGPLPAVPEGKLPPDLQAGMIRMRQAGWEPVLFPHALKEWGYLAGTDDERVADLMTAFRDPEIDAVFAIRGGYGASRILPRLDYEAITRHPKIFAGFSDITAFHAALGRRSRLITFHAPVPAGGYRGKGNFEHLAAVLTGQTCQIDGRSGEDGTPATEAVQLSTLRGGTAEGRLLGGNISMLCALTATPYQPDTRGAVLVLEDVGEAPYRLDRMLTHLGQAGWFEGIRGLVIGELVKCAAPPQRPSLTSGEVVADRL
ncbi:MAG: LD-carboxypeptidase, partial [Thermaerobacterales bacterium]